MRAFLVFLALAATPLMADDASFLPDGDYMLDPDGEFGSLTLHGPVGSIILGTTGTCSGGIEGAVHRTPERISLTTVSGPLCRVTIEPDPSGNALAVFGQSGGCTNYHGASCRMVGTVVGPDMPISPQAITNAFRDMPRDLVEGVQRVLQAHGTYTGPIDGDAGPGTRTAFLRSARMLHRSGTHQRLDFELAVLQAVSEITLAVGPASPSAEPLDLDPGLPFMGAWDCEGMAMMTFGPDGYGQGGREMAYADLVELGDDLWGMEMTDGYRVTVLVESEDWITWQSPASGETFRCRRVED